MIEYSKILKADLIEMHKAEVLKANDQAVHIARLEADVHETKLQRDAAVRGNEIEQRANEELEKEASEMRLQILQAEETIDTYKKAHEMNAQTIEKLMKDRDTAALDKELALKSAQSSFDAMQLFRRKVEQVERDSTVAVLDAGTYSASEHKQAIMNAIAKLPNIDGELRQMILKAVHAVPLRK